MTKRFHTLNRQTDRKNLNSRGVRATSDAVKMIEQLEQRVLLSVATITNNPSGTPVDGSLTLSVDSYGAFGENFPQSGVLYDPFTANVLDSVQASALYFQPAGGFLTETNPSTGLAYVLSGNPNYSNPGLPGVPLTPASNNSVTSTFTIAGFQITLTQTVGSIPAADGTTQLVQTYAIKNVSNATYNSTPFTVVRFFRAGMHYTMSGNWGGLSGDNRIAIAFDDPSNPSIFERIDVSGQDSSGANVPDWDSPVGIAPTGATSSEDAGYFAQIVSNQGIPAADNGVVQGDTSGDLLDDTSTADSPTASLALQDTLTVPIGATVIYTTTTGWGDTGTETPQVYRQPGTWAVTALQSQVQEGQNATVQITRTDGSLGHASVTFDDDSYPQDAKTGTADDPNADILDIADTDSPPNPIILADGETGTGAGSFSANPTIPVFNDTKIEGNENFFVVINNPTFGATISTTAPDAEITIPANDQPAPFHFATTNPDTSNPVTMTWNEGAPATIAVMRNADDGGNPNTGPYGNFNVAYTITGGQTNPATPGIDFVDNTPNSVLDSTTHTYTGSLQFIAATPDTINQAQYQYIDLQMLTDNLFEGNETFTITLEPSNQLLLTSPSTFTGTIIDAQTSGPVHLVNSAENVSEDAGTKTIDVVRTGSTDSQATVGYSVAGVPGGAVPGVDFTVLGGTLVGSAYTGTLTFDQGSTTPETPLVIQLIATNKQAPSKALTITLTNPNNIANLIGSPAVETLTITNSNTPGVIHFVGSANQTVVEGPDPITGAPYKMFPLQVTRDPTLGSQGTVSVDYTTVDGTAVAGTDYEATSGTLTWADGQTGPQTIFIKIFDDTTSPYPRANKSFSVNLSLPSDSAAALSDPSSVNVTITNPTQPGVNLGGTSYTAYEKDPSTGLPGTANIVVQRGLAPGQTPGPWSFSYVVIPGTATPGVDYSASFGATTPTAVTVDATQDSYTIQIPILADNASLSDTNFTVRLTSASPSLGSITSATVTIVNANTSVQVGQSSYNVTPGTGSVPITITRTGRTDVGVNVSYATADGTALAGRDYTTTDGTILIPAGQSSVTVNVPILTPVGAQLPTRSFSFAITGATLADSSQTNSITLSANSTPSTINISGLVIATNIQLLSGNPSRIERIVVTFSDPLDAASANTVADYILTAGGRNGVFNKAVPLSNARYDAASDSVTLFPKKPLGKNHLYELSIDSTGALRSVGGQRFYTGAPGGLGGTEVGTFARGTHVKYSDPDGDIVTLKMKHGGSMDFIDGLNGSAPSLILTGTSKTSLDGSLKPLGDGHTIIASISNPNNVQDLLTTNPLFSVENI